MIVFLFLAFLVGLAIGAFLVHIGADASFTTYDRGATWYERADIRKPVKNEYLLRGLDVVRSESAWSSAKEMTIEVRI